ncbi:MAG TPA: hypothetical protein DD458_18875 [Prolixibacteraceae bacterium]|nr:hypothetical protein [Prolixibacteraceae bacterium]HCU62455.1 hypothetical protein [Prolixibacteraceae bacterium]
MNVYSKDAIHSGSQLDISKLNEGLYTVIFTDDQIHVVKFVKN